MMKTLGLLFILLLVAPLMAAGAKAGSDLGVKPAEYDAEHFRQCIEKEERGKLSKHYKGKTVLFGIREEDNGQEMLIISVIKAIPLSPIERMESEIKRLIKNREEVVRVRTAIMLAPLDKLSEGPDTLARIDSYYDEEGETIGGLLLENSAEKERDMRKGFFKALEILKMLCREEEYEQEESGNGH